MNNIINSCDPSMIGRFFDKELGPEDYARFDSHIKSCSSCRKSIEELEAVSGQVKAYIHRSSEAGYTTVEEKVLRAIRKREAHWWIKGKDMLLTKRVLFPATAIVTLAVVLLVFFMPTTSSGPSAIISSVSGEVSSIIIMETPQTRQTILWFNEKS
ncbi:anti-sigma factor family protein [Thermodesulfobacteriota bacterium]